MFDKAIIQANLERAGFSAEDLAALTDALQAAKDERAFRQFITHMNFAGKYKIVYPFDAPWYRAFNCIP